MDDEMAIIELQQAIINSHSYELNDQVDELASMLFRPADGGMALYYVATLLLLIGYDSNCIDALMADLPIIISKVRNAHTLHLIENL